MQRNILFSTKSKYRNHSVTQRPVNLWLFNLIPNRENYLDTIINQKELNPPSFRCINIKLEKMNWKPGSPTKKTVPHKFHQGQGKG
jgi:hypothetical protein